MSDYVIDPRDKNGCGHKPCEVDVEKVGEEGSLCETSYDGDDVDRTLRDIAREDP